MSEDSSATPNDAPAHSGTNSTPDEEQTLLRLAVVDGELRSTEHSSPLRWSMTIGRTGAVAASFNPVQVSQATAWLLSSWGAKGKFLPRLSIRGTTPDGITVESDHVYLVSHNTSSDSTGTTISLEGDVSQVRIIYHALPETSHGIITTYFTIGMRAFRRPSVETALGRVTLSGPTEIDDPDHVNGRVHIEAPTEDRPVNEWLSDCDNLTKRVLDMVSLAEGGLIRWSVRQTATEDTLLTIDCEGTKGAGAAWDGVFHHLHLQPALDLAVSHYTEELCERTGMAIALEWFVHHSHYAELQLIAAMTALEHLVSVFVQNQGTPKVIGSEMFDRLLTQMKALWQTAIETAPEEEKSAVSRVRDKLTHLNEGSFRDKLEAMLTTYKVPLAGLELGRINKAVAARNRVVHRGLYQSKDERAHIQDHVSVLRELLKRIFLTFLQYKGQYFSLLNGPEWNSFPPHETSETSQNGA